MRKRMGAPFLLMGLLLSAATPAQELAVSFAAKTYTTGEHVWVNFSVINATAIPGAYKVVLTYNAENIEYVNVLPAEDGPFAVTPAVAQGNGTLTVAGFQGIADTGNGMMSLATLVFTPKNGSVTIDTASFTIQSREVYSAQAAPMDLSVKKLATSVLLPGNNTLRKSGAVTISGNYIRFSLPQEGMASVRIFDVRGRMVATPLVFSRCKAGHQAVPVGQTLRSGVYIVSVRGAGIDATKRLEVLR